MKLGWKKPHGMFTSHKLELFRNPTRKSESLFLDYNYLDTYSIDDNVKCPSGWYCVEVSGKKGYVRLDHRMQLVEEINVEAID